MAQGKWINCDKPVMMIADEAETDDEFWLAASKVSAGGPLPPPPPPPPPPPFEWRFYNLEVSEAPPKKNSWGPPSSAFYSLLALQHRSALYTSLLDLTRTRLSMLITPNVQSEVSGHYYQKSKVR